MDKKYSSLTRRTRSNKFLLESHLDTTFKKVELSNGGKLIDIASKEIALKINPIIDGKVDYDTVSAKGVINEYMFGYIQAFKTLLENNSYSELAKLASSEKTPHLGHTICFSKDDETGDSFNLSFKMFRYKDVNQLIVELTILKIKDSGEKDYTTFTSFVNYALRDYNIEDNLKSKLRDRKGMFCPLIDDLCSIINLGSITENLPFGKFVNTI